MSTCTADPIHPLAALAADRARDERRCRGLDALLAALSELADDERDATALADLRARLFPSGARTRCALTPTTRTRLAAIPLHGPYLAALADELAR